MAAVAASTRAASACGSPSEPSSVPSAWTTSGSGGGAVGPSSEAPRPAPGEPGGRMDTMARPARTVAQRDRGGLQRRRRDGRLHQHVDGATAGEAHVPGLRIADAEAHDPLLASGGRGLHVLGGGAFHAATTDRTGDAPIGRAQHGGALAPRRRAEGADDHGPGDRLAVGGPGLERRQELPHATAPVRGTMWAAASRWTRGTPLRSGRRLRCSAISASSSPSR